MLWVVCLVKLFVLIEWVLKLHAHTHIVTRTLSVLHTHGVSPTHSVAYARRFTHAQCVVHAPKVCRTRTVFQAHTGCHAHAQTGCRAHARTGRRAHARRFTHAQGVVHAHMLQHVTHTHHRMHAQCATCHAHVLYTQHVTYMSCSQHTRTHTRTHARTQLHCTSRQGRMLRGMLPPPLAICGKKHPSLFCCWKKIPGILLKRATLQRMFNTAGRSSITTISPVLWNLAVTPLVGMHSREGVEVRFGAIYVLKTV